MAKVLVYHANVQFTQLLLQASTAERESQISPGLEYVVLGESDDVSQAVIEQGVQGVIIHKESGYDDSIGLKWAQKIAGQGIAVVLTSEQWSESALNGLDQLSISYD